MQKFRTITAKYPGSICKRCGCEIQVGETIRWGGKGKTYHLKSECGEVLSEMSNEAPSVPPKASAAVEASQALPNAVANALAESGKAVKLMPAAAKAIQAAKTQLAESNVPNPKAVAAALDYLESVLGLKPVKVEAEPPSVLQGQNLGV